MTKTSKTSKKTNSDKNEMVLMSLWSCDKDDENLSDWTLTVNGKKRYYVHRIALAPPEGPRVCRYFVPLFFSPKVWNESKTCSSEVELPPGAAAIMDRFLDYVYTGKTDVGVETYVQLRFLANYFGCEAFLESESYKLSKYIPAGIEAVVAQFDVANEYYDDEYLQSLSQQITKCLSKHEFVHKYDEEEYDGLFDGERFDRTLLLDLKPPDDHCLNGVESVFYYASVRRILIDVVKDPANRKELFEKMTSVEKLTKIGQPWLALRLMYDESFITKDALGDSMSGLQQRCMDVLNTSSDMEFFEDKEVHRVVKRILEHRHSPELETSGFFEVLTAMMAARCTDSDSKMSRRKKKRQRTGGPPAVVAFEPIDGHDTDDDDHLDDNIVDIDLIIRLQQEDARYEAERQLIRARETDDVQEEEEEPNDDAQPHEQEGDNSE